MDWNGITGFWQTSDGLCERDQMANLRDAVGRCFWFNFPSPPPPRSHFQQISKVSYSVIGTKAWARKRGCGVVTYLQYAKAILQHCTDDNGSLYMEWTLYQNWTACLASAALSTHWYSGGLVVASLAIFYHLYTYLYRYFTYHDEHFAFTSELRTTSSAAPPSCSCSSSYCGGTRKTKQLVYSFSKEQDSDLY